MKTLAEIPARDARKLRAGALRRSELDALEGILDSHGSGALLVTGAGDGPAALSTGLASAATARGVRTALVDCDLADPVLADALGLAPSPGLNEYLREQAEAREILQPLVLAGPASREAAGPLVFVAGGEPEDAPPSAWDGLSHALEKLRHAYELVVLLGPPVGDETGALREAAEAADAVLACVGPHLTSGRAGRRVAKALRRLPAEEAGVVVYGADGG